MRHLSALVMTLTAAGFVLAGEPAGLPLDLGRELRLRTVYIGAPSVEQLSAAWEQVSPQLSVIVCRPGEDLPPLLARVRDSLALNHPMRDGIFAGHPWVAVLSRSPALAAVVVEARGGAGRTVVRVRLEQADGMPPRGEVMTLHVAAILDEVSAAVRFELAGPGQREVRVGRLSAVSKNATGRLWQLIEVDGVPYRDLRLAVSALRGTPPARQGLEAQIDGTWFDDQRRVTVHSVTFADGSVLRRQIVPIVLSQDPRGRRAGQVAVRTAVRADGSTGDLVETRLRGLAAYVLRSAVHLEPDARQFSVYGWVLFSPYGLPQRICAHLVRAVLRYPLGAAQAGDEAWVHRLQTEDEGLFDPPADARPDEARVIVAGGQQAVEAAQLSFELAAGKATEGHGISELVEATGDRP